jgi:ubiquinone biosynthesis protein Coq4
MQKYAKHSWSDIFHWLLAIKPGIELMINFKRTDCVFDIYNATKYPFNRFLTKRMQKHQNYSRVKNGEFAYFKDKINDMEYLKRLPKNTLGYHCYEFFQKTNSKNRLLIKLHENSQKIIKKDQQNFKAFKEQEYSSEQTVYIHDILHVLTGYGVHSFGEGPLQIFSWYQLRLPAALLISIYYTLFTTIKHRNLITIKTFFEGKKLGKASDWILMEDLGKLLEEDVDVVRKRYNIGEPKYYLEQKQKYELEKNNVV